MSRGAMEVIPGVGPSISRDLEELGYSEVADLRGQDPEPELLKWWSWKDRTVPA